MFERIFDVEVSHEGENYTFEFYRMDRLTFCIMYPKNNPRQLIYSGKTIRHPKDPDNALTGMKLAAQRACINWSGDVIYEANGLWITKEVMTNKSRGLYSLVRKALAEKQEEDYNLTAIVKRVHAANIELAEALLKMKKTAAEVW